MPAVTHLADVPLNDLLPDMSAQSQQRLIRAADLLDRARLRSDRASWRWYDEHVTPEPTSRGRAMPLIVGTALTISSARADWLELALDLWRSVPPLVVVTAAVEVACWCVQDHGMHPVQESEWLAGSGDALAHSFEAAVDLIHDWLHGPHDPRVWRARAGMPNPTA